MKTNKKLTLRKEKIASLTNDHMNNIRGGKDDKSKPSSQHPNFTCCWCSFGATAPKNCPDEIIAA